ncbi:carbohydrate ABC transporter permease [Shumkonia mesophila]|uniref:carbohydrate ABC transporter permease n=1 Tax=Shumkonia mesophila TaxID=2838854 RepID=UPI002934B3FF|nr:carbohydrate ABC transporter permease [Shumkonia mesophila]
MSNRPLRLGKKPRPLSGAVIALLVAMTVFPFAWLVLMSFKSANEIFAGAAALFFHPTLENYAKLLNPKFLGSFANSAIASTVSTALALVIGVPGAYALARPFSRKSRLVSILILLSRMLPPIAFTIPYFLLYRMIGLLDTLPGLIVIYLTFNLSLVVWLMRNFFEGIPPALEEAALIDGADLWKAFTAIILPLSGPALVTTAILCFLYSWNDFFFALILTRTNAATAPIQVVNFMNYEGWEWGKIAAGATLIMAPVLLFSLLLRKFLVSGLTAGAVKQ